MSGDYLSPTELAEMLGVPVATVYAWRHVGYGPPGMKLGRHVRFRRADVETWVEARVRADSRSTLSVTTTGAV